MKEQPIRVLHVFTALDQGGVENFVMNMYRNINTKKVQFDFALTAGRKSVFDEEVLQRGGKIYYFKNPQQKSILNYWRNFQDIFKENGGYSVVHSHCYFFSSIILIFAKLLGSNKRIAHSHETYKGQKYTIKRKMYEYISRNMINIFATDMLGCSKQACHHLFGENCFNNKKVKVINNAIDISKFTYSEEKRNLIRKQYNIEGNFVIGNIGRMVDQKNQLFLIDIFKEIHTLEPNAKLLLIGEGELRKSIEKRIQEYSLTNQVILTGILPNTFDLLQGMDIFVLPSKYEGLGIVAIEAQTASLRTICATTVPNDANITDLFEFMSLDNSAREWAEAILEYNKGYPRQDQSEHIIAAGFEIKSEALKLQNIYVNV